MLEFIMYKVAKIFFCGTLKCVIMINYTNQYISGKRINCSSYPVLMLQMNLIKLMIGQFFLKNFKQYLKSLIRVWNSENKVCVNLMSVIKTIKLRELENYNIFAVKMGQI
jgi:hypothetical protein